MYIEEKPTWLRIVLRVRGSVLPKIWRRVVVSTLVSTIATALQEQTIVKLDLTTTPFVLIGLPLGIFLGFKNNASYDRFWEGRRLWGQLVNTSRSITRQWLTLITAPRPEDEEAVRAFQKEMIYRHVGFVHALRMHLREEMRVELLEDFLPLDEIHDLKSEPNIPNAILQRTADRLVEARKKGWIDPFHVNMLEQSFVILADVQGACERIKNTPIPFSYTVLIHRIVAIYCVLLPFGLAQTIHLMTPVVVMFISYAFFGLDAIGDEIENPFGRDVNDLPLFQLSRMIEGNVRKRVGDTDLPPPVKPHRGVLL